MPRITKPSERRRLIKSESELWSLDLERKYLRPLMDSINATYKEFSTNKYNYNARASLFDIIEQIVEDTLPKTTSEFFDKMIDIKEVPYGRYNSDTDYRGSGTELS
jgi:hypothetical protein